MDATLAILTESIARGEEIGCVNFGTLSVIALPSRQATDPRDGKVVSVPPSGRLRFKPGRRLQEAANRYAREETR
jgi:DNA-binding protein HU-beta